MIHQADSSTPERSRIMRSVSRFDSIVERGASPLRRIRGVDRAAHIVSEAANHSILWHSLNAIDAVVGGPTHRRSAARRSVILGVEQALVNGVIKSVFRRSRPQIEVEHEFHLRKPRTSSFPSGHASAGACAATLLSDDLGYSPIWWTTAAVVSWSRIHVQIHHPSDVVGGILVGRTLALATRRLWPADQNAQRIRRR